MLGPVDVVADGQRLDLGSGKQRAALALLMLTPDRVVAVDRLVDELWGDEPPGTAKHALQVYVSGLRKALHGGRKPADDEQLIVTERPGYRLRIDPDACDGHRFERLARAGSVALRNGDALTASSTLARALALWRGPVFADLVDERFARIEAARLDELRLAAIEDRVEADLALGRHGELIPELEALIADNPLRERLWGLRILALYRVGRQADALRAYTGLRTLLRDELGLEPSTDLQALEAAILSQSDDLTWRPAAAAAEPVAAPQPDTTPEPAAPATGAVPTKPMAGQRRVATVLFADLAGFTSFAEHMDPEDVMTMVDRCMRRLGEIVARYGGTVENVVGDSIMAVFGAPVAHEDDAERAVRAGLEMQRCAAEEKESVGGLELRVGINTGDVMYAPVGPDDHRRFTVMGDAVNSAQRLESIAEPGSVYVGEQTRLASRAAVAYRTVGEQQVKGRREVLAVYEALDVSSVPRARRQGSAPLIGRDAETDLLVRVWQRAITERRPHLVSIIGEPGIGKSRLTAEFERLIGDGARVLHGRCLPYGEAVSYWAVAEALKEAAGVGPNDDDASVRAKVGAVVAEVEPIEEDGAILARHLALLGGFDEARDRTGDVADAQTLHRSARRFLAGLARHQPTCVVVEDIHWADDALLDLIDAVLRTQDAPLVVLTQARPELLDRRPGWGGGLRGFVSVPLDPLDHSSTAALVHELGRAHSLDGDVLDGIASLAGGNPLFAEELVATVAERGADAGVPRSLKSLLLARIDALPDDEQEALRLASIFGLTFWQEGIDALAEVAKADLVDLLGQLEWRDLVHEQGRSELTGSRQYAFKHILIRDAAYETLPRATRQALHQRAGDWLAAAAGARVDDYVGPLAHHAVQAGEPEKAVRYLVAGADRANRAAAHRREAAQLAQAIELAERTPAVADLVAELRVRRGRAFVRVGAWAEARGELERALDELPADAERRRGEALADLAQCAFWMMDTPGVRKFAGQAAAVIEGHDDLRLAAHAMLANADSADGEVELAIKKSRAVIAEARARGIEPPYTRLNALPLQLYLTGESHEAINVSREAVAKARSVAEPAAAMWQFPQLAMALAAVGRYAEATEVFAESRRFGQEYEVTTVLPRAVAMSAGFRLDLFDYAGAQSIQEEARELARSAGFPPTVTSAGIDLLLNLVRQGELGQAERLVREIGPALEGAGGWHGWLWKLRFAQAQAELALADGDGEAAATHAVSAIEQSVAKLRRKYQLLGRTTLGLALAAMGRKADGIAELSRAAGLAEELENPALVVRVAAARVSVDDDVDTSPAIATIDKIVAELDEADAKRFLDSEPARALMR